MTPAPALTHRYRLKLATWTVVRDAAEPSPRLIDGPEAAARLGKELFCQYDDDKERFIAVLLNQRHCYLLHTVVSVGSQSCTIVHPREVFGPALREGAAALLLLHNHPSGNPAPSDEDLRITKKLTDAGELVGIKLLDHIIIGSGSGLWASCCTGAGWAVGKASAFVKGTRNA